MSQVYRVDLSTKNYPNNIFEFIIHYKSSYHGVIDPDIIKLSNESFTEDQLKSLNYIFKTKLTIREKEVMIQRFQNKKTLREIADIFKYTGNERPRQIVAKACRKISHPANLQFIINGYHDENDRCNIQLEHSIDYLQFSVRTYNCLKRAGIHTIGELKNIIENNPDKLLKVRNLGEKSVDEIYDKMNKFLTPTEKSESDGIDPLYYISNLNLSPRSYNAISRYGIHTTSELLTLMYDPVVAINEVRNFGIKSFIEVGEKLVSLGLMEQDFLDAFKANKIEPKPEQPIEYTTEFFDKIDEFMNISKNKIGEIPYPFNLLAQIVNFSDFTGDNRFRISDDKLLGLEFAIQTLDKKEREIIISEFCLKENKREFLLRTGYTNYDIIGVKEYALRKLKHPYRYTFIKDGYFGSHHLKNLSDINFIDIAELNRLEKIDPRLIYHLDHSFHNCTIGMLKDAILTNPKNWYKNKSMSYGLNCIGVKKNKEIIRYLISIGILDISVLENI